MYLHFEWQCLKKLINHFLFLHPKCNQLHCNALTSQSRNTLCNPHDFLCQDQKYWVCRNCSVFLTHFPCRDTVHLGSTSKYQENRKHFLECLQDCSYISCSGGNHNNRGCIYHIFHPRNQVYKCKCQFFDCIAI